MQYRAESFCYFRILLWRDRSFLFKLVKPCAEVEFGKLHHSADSLRLAEKSVEPLKTKLYKDLGSTLEVS